MINMQYKAMAQKNNYKWKSILLAILILGLLLPVIFFPEIQAVVTGTPASDQLINFPFMPSRPSGTCYVSPNETVTEWKGTSQSRCTVRFGGICVWPIPHEHQTYKVTITDNSVPLRNEKGSVIAATSGDIRSDWLTYDSNSWNELANYSNFGFFRRNPYSDYQPIASNEYVVMVQTRYRLFNNVDSTLGICVEKP